MSAEACAKELLDVVPLVMRFIRSQMRRHRAAGLSVPQFRTLMFIHRNKDASPTGVSEHLGLTPASTSVLVDGLARRSFLRRNASDEDRRRVSLTLTPVGRKALDATLRDTRKRLADSLAALNSTELQSLKDAMQLLRCTFSAAGSNGA